MTNFPNDGAVDELLRQCTVRIGGTESGGSGFFIAPGLVLTCAHVIEEEHAAGQLVEVYWQRNLYQATINGYLAEDLDGLLYPDLALLKLNVPDHPCVYLDEAVGLDDDYYSYGYPEDYRNGDSSTFKYEGPSDDPDLLKLKGGQLKPGFSGAPLLNRRTGAVCGIVKRTRDENSDLGGRAVPTSTILREFHGLAELQQDFHRTHRSWITALDARRFGGRPLLRNHFQSLIERSTKLFGGRQGMLEQIGELIRDRTSGYLIIKAPAGFGKTALMANLVSGDPHLFNYHFFAPLVVSPSVTEGFFLRNIVEQMARWYDYDGPLEDETQVDALAARYYEFLSRPPKQPTVLILDGLDEVSDWKLAPYLDRRLPAVGLRVIATVRDLGQDLDTEYQFPEAQREVWELSGLSRKGVEEVFSRAGGLPARIARDSELFTKVLALAKYQEEPAAGADPFYVRLLAEDLAEITVVREGQVVVQEKRGRRSVPLGEYLDRQPKGLENYLDEWWRGATEAVGEEAVWDLLGTLAVTLGPISREDLEAINPSLEHPRRNDWFEQVRAEVRRLVARDDVGDYALAHPRLKEHLERKIKTHAYLEKVLAYCGEWQRHKGPYALRYYAQHLVQEEQRKDAGDCCELTELLVRLVTNPRFQEAHAEVVDDAPALQRDLERAVEVAAKCAGVGVELLVEAARALVRLRRDRLDPRMPFELARQARIEEAIHHLNLFNSQLDRNWYDALRLAIAWLAFDLEPEHARALRDRLAVDLPPEPTLDLLRHRLAADMDGEPLRLPPLNDAPRLEVVEGILERMTNDQGFSELRDNVEVYQESMMTSPTIGEMISEREYLAVRDGPVLVAAHLNSGLGDEYLRRYVDVHSKYGYVYYRNRSLWILLNAVLKHPDSLWVREWVTVLGDAALAPSVEFEEGLDITLLAFRAVAGELGAAGELESREASVMEEISRLSPTRQGDPWATHKRRLIALAEVFSVALVLGRNPADLIELALEIPHGFAGYNAPAYLTLSEAAGIVRPAEDRWVEEALERALHAAHNVRDETFCARITARVNAVLSGLTGDPTGLDVGEEIRKFTRDPSADTFASVHVIGDQYIERDPDATLEIDRLRSADTLEKLAQVYDRPLAELERLNRDRGWRADQPLPNGERVRMYDPEFAPLVAARLAARVLANGSLIAKEKSRLIRLLVPVAAANPTALDTMLSRLLLASAPMDSPTLRALQ